MYLGPVGISGVWILKDLLAHMASGRLVWKVQHAVMPLRSAFVIGAESTSQTHKFAIRFLYSFRLCRIMNSNTDFITVFGFFNSNFLYSE